MSADILLKIVVVVYVASTLAACSGKFVCKNKHSGRFLLVTCALRSHTQYTCLATLAFAVCWRCSAVYTMWSK